MNREEFEKIFDSDCHGINVEDCIFRGLEIIRKYIHKADISCAEHDQIWSVDCDSLIEAGISKINIENLCGLGWFIDEDALSHFT
jgi:hypothetical protein